MDAGSIIQLCTKSSCNRLIVSSSLSFPPLTVYDCCNPPICSMNLLLSAAPINVTVQQWEYLFFFPSCRENLVPALESSRTELKLKIIWIFALVRICWNLLIISVLGWSSHQAFWHALHRERWMSPNKIKNCLRCLCPFPNSQQKVFKDGKWKSNITSSSESTQYVPVMSKCFYIFLTNLE